MDDVLIERAIPAVAVTLDELADLTADLPKLPEEPARPVEPVATDGTSSLLRDRLRRARRAGRHDVAAPPTGRVDLHDVGTIMGRRQEPD